jgi:transposase-like protein
MDGEPAVATALGIASKTVRKWRDRFAAEGAAGFADRSSRPHRSPRQVAEPIQAEIARLRRERLSGPAIALRPWVLCCAASAWAAWRPSTRIA